MSEKQGGFSGWGQSNSLRPLFIETDRLSIRSIEGKDLQAFHAVAGQRAVAEMLASIPHPFSLDEARDWLAARKYVGAPGFVAGIFLKDGGLVGCIGLTDYPRTVNYFIDPAHWGRGYATEVITPFLDWCAETFALDEYWVGVIDTNKGSCKVLEKAGFDLMYASRFQSDVRPKPDRLLIYWKGYGAEKPLVQHTRRLFLSPLHLAHAKRLSEITDDADVDGLVSDVRLPFTPENARHWIKSAQEHENIFPMAIVLKEGKLIGAGYIEMNNCEGCIAIWLGRNHRRNGFAAEAFCGLIGLAFDRFATLNAIEYVVGSGDAAAIRLLEGMNFAVSDTASRLSRFLSRNGDAIAYRLERGQPPLPPSNSSI